MRKGYTIIEMMAVIAVIVILSIPTARLSRTILHDVPKSFRTIEANTGVLNALKQMRTDINAARKFPESFKDFTADSNTLLVETAK